MQGYDRNSHELHELQEMEEERLHAELGRCPGPVDLFTSAVDRRAFIKVGMGGFLSLMFAQWLDPRVAEAQVKAANGKAKSCILLWMNGGPSHIDTWDPKPGTATGGSFKALDTRLKGLQIGEHLPALADVADRLTVVRSMTSKEGNHQRAQYLVHTGYAPNPTVQHPSFGSWVGKEIGDTSADLPNFVSISGPSIGAGFLGVQHGPFVVQNPAQPVQNSSYARGIDESRFQTRSKALSMLEGQFAAETKDAKVGGKQAVYAKAVRMMHSPKMKAFDLTDEPEAVKTAYGDTNFGRGCLMARRLVESGVKFVEVVLDGWDTHQDNFGRVAKQCQTFDSPMAQLIKDLEARNLLDSTLIVWMGEFGRTPKINPNDGRDHYPTSWSAVLAGGGARKGYVHGTTDAEGTKPVDKIVQVPDFFATVSTLLGMSPEKSYMTPVGRPISITDKGNPVSELIAS